MTYPEFKARYALTPDPQQEAAILRAEGPTLLLAVPGSGKTTTLVTRLGYLIHWSHTGSMPEHTCRYGRR